jgi:hypothetical protein
MLSKKIIVLIGLFAILFIGEFNASAQTYSAPKRLLLKGDRVREDFESRSLIKELFYPIGWSKDGKFAFYVEPPDEACGCYFGHLVIQDMRTDKILWEKQYQGSEEKQENLQTVWRANQKEFSRKLAEYGIVAQKSFIRQAGAFKYQKDLLTPKLTNNVKFENGSDLGISGNFFVELISKQNGKKTLYEQRFDPAEYESFMDVELSGSLLSPFEPRAAVILVETQRGYEGPPHTTHIRVVGAALTAGFKAN